MDRAKPAARLRRTGTLLGQSTVRYRPEAYGV